MAYKFNEVLLKNVLNESRVAETANDFVFFILDHSSTTILE